MRKAVLAAVLAVLSLAPLAAEEPFRITILHTNDLHGWMLPFDYLSGNGEFANREFVDASFARSDAGGLARRASLIKSLRASATNPVALVDSGDIFARGPWHLASFGEPEIKAYNRMGYDMACIGNNEFKGKPIQEGQGLLLKLLRESEFPWICANLAVGDSDTPVAGVRPFIVRRYGSVKVGFMGLTAKRSESYPQTRGWTISDPLIAAARWVPIARAECDILIAVTHIGIDEDKRLAASIEGIDAIIGGDSHPFIPAPIEVKNPKGAAVPIVQGGAYGVMLGVLDLTFEKAETWMLKNYAGKLVPIDAKAGEDKDVKALLDGWNVKPNK